jgi:chaperonin GroEL
MDSKIIEFGQNSRDKIASGVRTLAKAVACTLGPRGRNVVLQRRGLPPHITKDGVSVAREIVVKDPFANMGAQMVKEVASRTADLAGDGTTTATVLADAIVAEGLRLIVARHDPMPIKRGIDKAAEAVVAEIKKLSKQVEDIKEVEQVATISANGDTSIGKMIASAMEVVGKDGVITLEEGKGFESTVRAAEGFEFDRGFLSPHFCNDKERQRVVFEKPLIWLVNSKLTSAADMEEMLPLFQHCSKHKVPLVVIADSIEGEVLGTMVVNSLRNSLVCAAVKAPGFGDAKKEMMEDLAILTGAQIKELGIESRLIETQLSDLGTAERIIITREKTVVVGKSGAEDAIQQRAAQIRQELSRITDFHARDVLNKRLAKLIGGIAVIEVGAATDIEMKERKDRFEDALAATKAAIQEGIVPGGGVALVRAAATLENFTTGDPEEDIGVKIILKACSAPLMQIVANAGKSQEVVLNKVRSELTGTWGYDAATHEYRDMLQAGIIDPAQVTRVALQNAASVSSLILTTEAVVAIDESEENKSSTAHPGMMMG